MPITGTYDQLLKKISALEEKVDDLEFSNLYLSNTCKELEAKRIYYRSDREKKLNELCKVMKLEAWCSPKFLLDADIHKKYEFITKAVGDTFSRVFSDYTYYLENSDKEYLNDTPSYCDSILSRDKSERICIPHFCSDFKLCPKSIVALRIWINHGNDLKWNDKEKLNDEMKNDFTTMYEKDPLSILEVVAHTSITHTIELKSSLEDDNGYMTDYRDEAIEEAVNVEETLVWKSDLDYATEERDDFEKELDIWKELGEFIESSDENALGVPIPPTMCGSDAEECMEVIKYSTKVWNKRLETSKMAYDSLKKELEGKEEFDMMNIVEDIQKKSEDLINKNIELVAQLKEERKDYNRLMGDYKPLACGHYDRPKDRCASVVFHSVKLNPSWIKKALKVNGVIPTKDGAYPRAYLSMDLIKKVEYRMVRLLTDAMDIINIQHPQSLKKHYHVKENSLMDNVEKLMKYEVKDIHKFDNASFLDYGEQMETEEQKRIKDISSTFYNAGQKIRRRGTHNGEDRYYKTKDINCDDYTFY